jgi:hypothetical protein
MSRRPHVTKPDPMTNQKPSPKPETATNTKASGGCVSRLLRDFDFDRGEEYNDLIDLVNLAASLNKGSGIIDKIKAMEIIADRLTRSDMTKPRRSFMQWLGDVAFYFNSANAEVRDGQERSG